MKYADVKCGEVARRINSLCIFKKNFSLYFSESDDENVREF